MPQWFVCDTPTTSDYSYSHARSAHLPSRAHRHRACRCPSKPNAAPLRWRSIARPSRHDHESFAGHPRLSESRRVGLVRARRRELRIVQRGHHALRRVARSAPQHAPSEPHHAQRLADRSGTHLRALVQGGDRPARGDRGRHFEQFDRSFRHAPAGRLRFVLAAGSDAAARRLSRALSEREAAPHLAASSGGSGRRGVRRRHRRAAAHP